MSNFNVDMVASSHFLKINDDANSNKIIVTILFPRSHLAASALCWASCQSVSDTWSFEGTRSWRKWYCGHQSDRSFQSSPKLFFSCVAKYMWRVSANASQSLILCRQAAWSSLMKKAASASRSPFDWSAESKNKNTSRNPLNSEVKGQGVHIQ